MSVNARDLLHNATVYESPHDFRPERWLDTTKPIAERHFVPFNKGTRMCQGREYVFSFPSHLYSPCSGLLYGSTAH